MLFSRKFVHILNNADKQPRVGSVEPAKLGRDLARLRLIVTKWAAYGTMEKADLKWLNSKILRHRLTLLPSAVPGIPETTRDFGNAGLIEVAVTSFVEFLAAVEESHSSSTGRLAVKLCGGCGDFFIQESAGREKEYCSNRCKFRVHRKAKKAALEQVLQKFLGDTSRTDRSLREAALDLLGPEYREAFSAQKGREER